MHGEDGRHLTTLQEIPFSFRFLLLGLLLPLLFSTFLTFFPFPPSTFVLLRQAFLLFRYNLQAPLLDGLSALTFLLGWLGSSRQLWLSLASKKQNPGSAGKKAKPDPNSKV